jgi:hypothetical protein
MDYSDLNESMGAFESAVSSSKAHVKMPACGTILLAVDGSNQDATAIAIAAMVAPRLRAKVRVTMGSYEIDGKPDRGPAERAVAALKGRVDVEALYGEGPIPAVQILAVKRRLDAGLVIAPAPYIGDIGLLKDESLSSTIDVLLAEARSALLVVREPIDDVAVYFKRLLLPMTVYSPALAAAAGWAFSLAEGDATIDLFAVADRQAVETAAALTGQDASEDREATSADALRRAEQKHAGGMISAVQQKASETGVNVTVELEEGEPISLVLARLHADPAIAVVGAPLDRNDIGFHRAHGIVLGAKSPVLIARE